MKKCLAAVLGVMAILIGFLTLPFLPLAGATTDPMQGPKGYKTCFVERRALLTDGAPRLVKERRCVFAE